MEFNQPTYKEEYGKTIARIISLWFYDYLFEPCFRMLDGKTVENNNDILREALQNGYIYYQEGAFYSKTGKFTNAVALALEKIGAKYNRYKKAYILADVMLPIDLVWAIRTLKAQTAERVAGVLGYFTLFEANLLAILSKLALDTAVETILQDMQSRMRKEFAKKKIPMISMPLDSFQEEEFAKLYTENMYYWVKKFTEKEIKEMRQILGKMILQGKSRVTIAEYLMKKYKVSQRKALFLARNETGIALSSYQILTLKNEGFKYFKWHTILDGRERELHKQLNGRIFEIDNPPVIYINEKTGQEEKGYPKQTYNCRCHATGWIDKEFIQRRRGIVKNS